VFDIGWTELIVVACVAILVVGPKELPRMLRGIGKTMGNLRRMAGDFQRQFDDALKEAELDEVKKAAQSSFKPLDDAQKSMQAYEKKVKDSLAGNSKIEDTPTEAPEQIEKPIKNEPVKPASSETSNKTRQRSVRAKRQTARNNDDNPAGNTRKSTGTSGKRTGSAPSQAKRKTAKRADAEIKE
jgi:sec-independent protein translocase protein TatB